jgi:hypothetical protein
MKNNLKTHSLLAVENKVNIEEVLAIDRIGDFTLGQLILGRPSLRFFPPATPETCCVRLTPGTHGNFPLVSSFE